MTHCAVEAVMRQEAWANEALIFDEVVEESASTPECDQVFMVEVGDDHTEDLDREGGENVACAED